MPVKSSTITLLILVAGLTLVTGADNKASSVAPDFSLTDLNGDPYTLSELRGKVVLVNFWATWCGPCRYEIPDLSRLYDAYQDSGLIVLGISLDDAKTELVKKFAVNYKITYPVLHGPFKDLLKITQIYGGVNAIPTTFIIDREGNIVKKYLGPRSEKIFSEDIKPYL